MGGVSHSPVQVVEKQVSLLHFLSFRFSWLDANAQDDLGATGQDRDCQPKSTEVDSPPQLV